MNPQPFIVEPDTRDRAIDQARSYLLGTSQAASPAKLVIIIGAGVSIATHNAPSWPQLISLACDFAERDAQVSRSDIQRVRRAVDFGVKNGGDGLLRAVDKARLLLNDHQFRAFLCETFNKHRIEDHNASQHDLTLALDSLRRRGVRLATTNYDKILEDTMGLESIDWADNNLEQFVNSPLPINRTVLHIHGVYDRPEHVIFATPDYARLVSGPQQQVQDVTISERLQHWMAHIYTTCRVLFIGCGNTTADPHFWELFRRCLVVNPNMEPVHAMLCTDADYENLAVPDSIIKVPYGTHPDLANMVRRLFVLEQSLEDVQQAPIDIQQLGQGQRQAGQRATGLPQEHYDLAFGSEPKGPVSPPVAFQILKLCLELAWQLWQVYANASGNDIDWKRLISDHQSQTPSMDHGGVNYPAHRTHQSSQDVQPGQQPNLQPRTGINIAVSRLVSESSKLASADRTLNDLNQHSHRSSKWLSGYKAGLTEGKKAFPLEWIIKLWWEGFGSRLAAAMVLRNTWDAEETVVPIGGTSGVSQKLRDWSTPHVLLLRPRREDQSGYHLRELQSQTNVSSVLSLIRERYPRNVSLIQISDPKRLDRALSIHLLKDQNGNPKMLFDLPAYVRYCQTDEHVDQFFDGIAKRFGNEAEKLDQADWRAVYGCSIGCIDEVFPLAGRG